MPKFPLSKRLLDLVLAVPLLIVVLPLLALLALLARMNLGSPVFWKEQRPGLGAVPFMLLKFRTMTNACDAKGNLLPDAARLTRFGQLMRSSSLDELPELINVIRGEMSLVGPRPLLLKYLARYTPEQMRRHSLPPGITGWAQVSGRNALSWEEKFACDLWYVDHCSIWLDLKILALTVWRTVKREGISQPGHATMPEFMGSEEAVESK